MGKQIIAKFVEEQADFKVLRALAAGDVQG
jgi:hypothetical protein